MALYVTGSALEVSDAIGTELIGSQMQLSKNEFYITMRAILTKLFFIFCLLILSFAYSSAQVVPAQTVPAKPEIFETSFLRGTEINVDSLVLKFYPFDIGKINSTNGKIIACEPIMMYNEEAFGTIFPVGGFPVQLAIAKIDSNEIVAFSRILFSKEPVAKWEFALKDKQKPISLFGDSSYYYPVDGGLGGFIDEASHNKFEKLNEASQTQIMDNLFAELDKNTHISWQFANTSFKGINIIAFSAGLGDGRYSTYVGFDKDNKPCRLLTDFGLINWLKN